jgi:splicing factor 3A subunit 1
VNLPPLCTQRDVGSRILLQQRTEAAKVAAESVEMEMDTDSEDEDTHRGNISDQRPTYEVTQPAPAAPNPNSALVREDYDPKKARQQPARKPLPDKYIISPLTNERVSADKLHDHVRYNTMTTQYKTQQEAYVSFF